MTGSPMDPDTEWILVDSGTPVDEDGHKLGAPTGEVLCAACLRSAMNVDDIRHRRDCPQRHVRSEYRRRSDN